MNTEVMHFDSLKNHPVFNNFDQQFKSQDQILKERYKSFCNIIIWAISSSCTLYLLLEITDALHLTWWWFQIIYLIVSLLLFVILFFSFQCYKVFKYHRKLYNKKEIKKRFIRTLILELISLDYELFAESIKEAENYPLIIMKKKNEYFILNIKDLNLLTNYEDFRYIILNR